MGRFLFVIVVLLLVDLYAFQAVRNLGQSGKWVWFILYWVFSAISILWVILAATDVTDGWEQKYHGYTHFRAFVVILYFAKIFVLIPLLIDDIRRIFTWSIQYLSADPATVSHWPSRTQFLTKLALILGSIPLITLTYGMVRNPYRFQNRKISIAVKELPDEFEGLKILQISDLHSGTFKNATPFKSAVDQINAESPDLVFFTGDLVNSMAVEADIFIPLLSEIKSKYGVYSVLGNHDYGEYVNWESKEAEERNLNELFVQHEKMGWNLLRNESAQVEINGKVLNILGVENYSAMPHFQKYGDLEKTWNNSPGGDLNILLSHDPTHWDEQVIKDYPEIDLTLSGHTHGFQFGIEIPGYFRWSPSQWVYKRWAGLYRQGKQYLYVNRGLGCLGYPGRVGILPEITTIKFKKSV